MKTLTGLVRRSLFSEKAIGAFVFFVFILFSSYRAYYSNLGINPAYLTTIKNDLVVLLFLVSLAFSSYFSPSKIFKIIAKTILLAVLYLYVLDVLIFKYLHNRINIDDFFQYAGETAVIGEMISVVSSTKFGMASLLVIILLVALTPVYIFKHNKHGFGLTLKGVVGYLSLFLLSGYIYFFDTAATVGADSSSVREWKRDNIFKALSNTTYKNSYSNDVIASYDRVLTEYKKSLICENSPSEQSDVILVLVESLSSYHSKYFSGLKNYTPNIDRIAKENISFVNFYSNGFTTVGGYMSSLIGRIPVPRPVNARTEVEGGWIALQGFEKNPLTDSLPQLVARRGYKSLFLSNGDLTFAGSKAWLADIGFQVIEDASSKEYDGYKRTLFNAPADKALFDLAIKRIPEQDDKFFMTLSTISSHRPYTNPITGQPSDEGTVIRYVDKVIGEFYQQLNQIGYFDDGILIITADHRAMTAISSEEIALDGAFAPAKIPMIVVDKQASKPQQRVEERFQQIDIVPSINAFISGESCRGAMFGDFLSPHRSPPECVIFARGDNRNLVSTQCGENESLIILDGDKTRFISGDGTERNNIVEIINLLRVDG